MAEDNDQNFETDEAGSRLLKGVQAIAIGAPEAKEMVEKHMRRGRSRRPEASDEELRDHVARRIVDRYARLAATSGAATALAGVIPGLGTALAMVGGGLTDALMCMKFQVDMCYCLAGVYGYDLESEDAKHLAFLIAAGGATQRAGGEVVVQIGSKAGVRLVRQYLKGATLIVIRAFFRRLGIVFSRKALEKAIPFGVGVAVGSSANYAMTRYVGSVAVEWFQLDADTPAELDADE